MATVAFFHILPNSFFTNLSIIRRYLALATVLAKWTIQVGLCSHIATQLFVLWLYW
jgi:hypothetical protein